MQSECDGREKKGHLFHWGVVYIGSEQGETEVMAHLTGEVGRAEVRKAKIKEFAREIKIDNSFDKGLDYAPFTTRQDRPDRGFSQCHHHVIPGEETKRIIEKATCSDTKAKEDFLGKLHLTPDNCEQFANFCRYRDKTSKSVLVKGSLEHTKNQTNQKMQLLTIIYHKRPKTLPCGMK